MYALFSFSIYWLVTIDYKKIHLNRQGKPQAESTELMIALFFLSIQWNSHMLSHNRIRGNQVEQKKNFSSRTNGTYDHIVFLFKLFRKREPTPVHIDLFFSSNETPTSCLVKNTLPQAVWIEKDRKTIGTADVFFLVYWNSHMLSSRNEYYC